MRFGISYRLPLLLRKRIKLFVLPEKEKLYDLSEFTFPTFTVFFFKIKFLYRTLRCFYGFQERTSDFQWASGNFGSIPLVFQEVPVVFQEI